MSASSVPVPPNSSASAEVSPPSVELPPPTEDAPQNSTNPSNVGMTTNVVRGSAWAFGGQVSMLLASVIATPFVTGILGPQAYGVWALINVVIGTMSFADAGMGTASTKFASEAYAAGDIEGERAALWMALLVTAVPTLLIAIGVAIAAPWIVAQFFGDLALSQYPAVIGALRWAALGFAIRPVAHIFNSPLLARMRLDINTFVMAGGNIVQVLSVPLALWWGGLPWGAAALVINAALTSVGQLWLSSRLVPKCWMPKFSRELLRPMIRFGGPALVAAIAGQVLTNAERLLLPRYTSTEALGYYNIAITAAGILGVLPSALSQALLPAFSRLSGQEHQADLQRLISRAMRGVLFAILPVAVLMCAVARPFLTLWVGPNFALQSTFPLYYLTFAMAINVFAFVPYTLLLARGRTDFTALLLLGEMLPFVGYTIFLTSHFGLLGAAWSRDLRILISCAILFPVATRLCKTSFSPRIGHHGSFAMAVAALIMPLILLGTTHFSPWLLLGFSLMMIGCYAYLIFARVLENEERQWLEQQVSKLRARFLKPA